MDYLHQHPPLNKFDDVLLAAEVLKGSVDSHVQNRHAEMQTGQHIINRLAQSVWEDQIFELHRHQSGQPYGIIDGKTVGVSISHTRQLCLAAINCKGNIGIDLEPVDRRVHPGLHDRITSPLDSGCENLDTIRLWTIKEAALKWCGTGLRVAMKSVAVRHLKESFFKISIEHISALLLSFEYRKHWVAVAFNLDEEHR